MTAAVPIGPSSRHFVASGTLGPAGLRIGQPVVQLLVDKFTDKINWNEWF